MFVYVAILCVLIYFFPKADTHEFNESAETIHNEGIIPPSAILPMFIFSLVRDEWKRNGRRMKEEMEDGGWKKG